MAWKDISPGISFNCVHGNLQKQMSDKIRQCYSVKQLRNSQGVGDKVSQNAIVEPKGVKPIGVSALKQKWSVTAVDTHLCRVTRNKHVLDVTYIVKAMYQADNTELTMNN